MSHNENKILVAGSITDLTRGTRRSPATPVDLNVVLSKYWIWLKRQRIDGTSLTVRR
jgi:hypothetical protein